MVDYTVDYFEAENIDFIQFQFTTLFGDIRMVEFPAMNWDHMKDGTGVDGSSLGFLKTEQSDMRAIPDLNTFSRLPWNPQVGRFICDFYDNDGKPYSICPRGILKKIIHEAEGMGYYMKCRPELEWYFLDEDMDSAEYAKYMATTPSDTLHELRRTIAEDMIEMFPQGSPHTIHHEVGPGQQEIELSKLEGLAQADNVQLGKLICKTEAALEDLIATFMPKPFPNEAGNGLHIHMYMEDNDGNNVFAKENGISDILRYFIGGILHHTDALSAILNPSTNSYKRLTPNHEAPVHKAWGVGNRTALIRVPGYENKAHLEYRAGDGTMNIYLGLAGLLAAGLDGIRQKREPNTPTTKNIDHLSENERRELNITQIPTSLKESLDAFENSEFLKKTFGNAFFDAFLSKKRQEWLEYTIAEKNDYVEEWEFENYLDV
jgi:glutamine synthetase